MRVKFVCTYEGWQRDYDVLFVPNIGHDVNFPKHKGDYEVHKVLHSAITPTMSAARDTPSVKVYVRPRHFGAETKYLRRVANGDRHTIDPDLHAIDPAMEERRIA